MNFHDEIGWALHPPVYDVLSQADFKDLHRHLTALFASIPHDWHRKNNIGRYERFGNVQYAELMDFCYVWLKKLVGHTSSAFKAPSTRNAQELTGNVDMGRDLNHFTNGLSTVFQRMSKALKKGAPFVFTYHHNKLEAYYPVAVAILDADLVCSASLPCPGEMSSSIHINGTGSSIIDTVFVCRQNSLNMLY